MSSMQEFSFIREYKHPQSCSKAGRFRKLGSQMKIKTKMATDNLISHQKWQISPLTPVTNGLISFSLWVHPTCLFYPQAACLGYSISFGVLISKLPRLILILFFRHWILYRFNQSCSIEFINKLTCQPFVYNMPQCICAFSCFGVLCQTTIQSQNFTEIIICQ